MDTDSEAVGKLVKIVAPTLISNPNRYTELWDLDEVFWKNYAKPWSVSRALDAFVSLIDSYGPWAEQLVAGLQIWLVQTEALCTRTVNLDSLAALDINLDHPPAIFLAKKLRPISFYESYRYPLSQSLFTPSWGQIETYYECFRTPRALADNEPYDRTVTLCHRRELRVLQLLRTGTLSRGRPPRSPSWATLVLTWLRPDSVRSACRG